jgi:hypothetical protein
MTGVLDLCLRVSCQDGIRFYCKGMGRRKSAPVPLEIVFSPSISTRKKISSAAFYEKIKIHKIRINKVLEVLGQNAERVKKIKLALVSLFETSREALRSLR